jgi:DNA-binding helix-hairpin-helix protein with protein kinase domain
LANVERTVEHDNFGLAVAIFHLLFMGKHPYAGIRKGSETSMGEDIAQNRFAYSLLRQAQTQTKPPPGALTLDLFPEQVSDAFEKAFGLTPHARPSARDWIGVLSKLEGSLSRCSKVKTHYFPSAAKACVWCKLSAQSGLDLFSDLSAVAPNIPTDSQGTEQAIREILAFRFPVAGDLLPAVTVSGVSSALSEAQSGKSGQILLGLAIMAGAGAGFFYALPAWFIWIGLAFWGWSLVSDREVYSRPFLQKYSEADEQVQKELNNFVQRNGLTEVVKVRGDLDDAISAYKGHNDALARELSKLKSNREDRQRQAYLDQFSVRSAKISGIGPAKTATLISFGIETAADVNRSAVLRVPGFGDVMTGKLMAWRKAHEARFKYDRNPNAQDVADEKALRGRFMAEKAKLEATIRNGLGTLRNARAKIEALPTRAKNDPALLNALKARAQAERDLIELSVSVPTSTVSLTSSPAARQQQNPQTHTNRPPQNTRSVSGVPSCPRCGSSMRRRSGRYGRFWGCSRYPSCRGTRNI